MKNLSTDSFKDTYPTLHCKFYPSLKGLVSKKIYQNRINFIVSVPLKIMARCKGKYDTVTAELESTVGKKMTAVHFTTMPCEPNTAYEAPRKPNCLQYLSMY